MSEGPNRTQLEAVRKSVNVAIPPEDAFRRFTEEMAIWWPLDTHSVGQADAETVVFEAREGGRILERMSDGRTAEWGTVLVYEPPGRVVFSWHPGRDPDGAQEVEVRFVAMEGGTRVDLVHRGWEILGERAEKLRSEYDRGWDFVLGRYTSGASG